MRLLKIPNHETGTKFTALALEERSQRLYAAKGNGLIDVFDLKLLVETTNLESPRTTDIAKLRSTSVIDVHNGLRITSLYIFDDFLLSSDAGGFVYKTPLDSPDESVKILDHGKPINDIQVFSHIALFATVTKILSFNLNTSKQSNTIALRSDVRSISIDPNNAYLASISFNKSVAVYQIQVSDDDEFLFKKLINSSHTLKSINDVSRFSWSPTGDKFAVPNYGLESNTSSIGIISRSNWKSEFSLIGQSCSVVKFNPKTFKDGEKFFNIIASAGIDKSVAVWNTTFQRPLLVGSDVSSNSINDLQWTSDGLGLIVATESIIIMTFDAKEFGNAISDDEVKELKKAIKLPDPIVEKTVVPKAVTETVPTKKIVSTANGSEDINKTNGDTKAGEEKQDPSATPIIKDITPSLKEDPKALQVESKNGKKRIAPTLVSSLNGSKTIVQPVKRDNDPLSNSLTTMEFDLPTYSVPKELKRKEEFDVDSNGQHLKKRREAEAIEFIGSIAINPSTSFSKIRISTPKTRLKFTVESPNDDTLALDIRNGTGNEQKPTKITLLKSGTKQVFVDFIPKLISLGSGGEGDFWAVSTVDGTLYVYSDSGRRIFPPIVLGTPLSFLESKGKYLLAVTSIGEVYSWDVVAQKALFEPTSLYSLLSRSNPDLLTRAENLTMCSISSAGIPVVTVSNGNGYLFDKDMGTWVLVSDSWWAFGSQYWDSRDSKPNGTIIGLLEKKTNDEIVRRGRGKFLQKMAKTMLMKEGYENLEKTISLAHLENKILVSKMLKENVEFKTHLIIYCKRISELGLKASLLEIFQELLGPQSSGSDWEPKILSFDKHELLKEIIFACATIRVVQRILVQFATSLNILNQIPL